MSGRKTEESGYTLLEVSVVLLLVSLAATVGLTAGLNQLEAYRLESARTAFVGHLAEARSLSVSRNLPVLVRIHPDGHSFTATVSDVDPGSLWIRFPRDVLLTSQPSREVTFYSRGMATPSGSYTLENKAGEVRVIVAVSGRIRWEYKP